jgi:hypothetical protein
VVQSYSLRGSAWMHALLLVLTKSLYAGVPGFQGADRGPRAHLRRCCEPVGGTNFLAPRLIILSLYSSIDGVNMKTSTAGPREVPELKVRERPPSM